VVAADEIVSGTHSGYKHRRLARPLLSSAPSGAQNQLLVATFCPLDGGATRAKRLEVQLVKVTGEGTLDWTPEEIDYIQRTGLLPRGIVGHHINDVAQFPEWAGDPRNIMFVRGQEEDLAEHGGNFQNSTVGPLIDRAAMILLAEGGGE
jgi:hypothetical protein